MTHTENAVFDAGGDMAPPWLKYPDIPFGSIGWRMGSPEGYAETFIACYQALDGKAQAVVRRKYPAPPEWARFYGGLSPVPAEHADEDRVMRRCMAGIYGALAGDALGVPFEFKPPERIPALNEIQMAMPGSFEKTYSAIPYGTWSDDGAQLMCLLEALQSEQWFFAGLLEDLPQALGALLLRWMNQGYHQSGGVVYDCGGNTGRALRMIEQGVNPLQAGGTDSRSNGNGSLMRTPPVAIGALLRGWGLEDAVKLAHLQSRVTHAHPLAQACCALYCLTAIYVYKEQSRASAMECLRMAMDSLAEIYAANKSPEHLSALKEIEAFPKTHFLKGSGYVVDSLWTAVDCVDKSDSYANAVRRAVACGNDTDTTACVAGGLAGLRYGIGGEDGASAPRGIPEDWIAMLRIPAESSAVLNAVFGEPHKGSS